MNGLVVVLLHAMWGLIALVCVGTIADSGRFEVLPTPRGTIVIDHSTGAAYQHPALPMFQSER